jgi:hypothetical protein
LEEGDVREWEVDDFAAEGIVEWPWPEPGGRARICDGFHR